MADVLADNIMGKEASIKLKEYQEAVALKQRVRELRDRIASLQKRCEEEVEDLEEGVRNLQKNCKHQATDYQLGSGNNDSTTECLICGKYL